MKKSSPKKAGRPELEEELKHKPVSFSASPDLIKDINEKADLLFDGNRTKYIVYKLSQKRIVSGENINSSIEKAELYKLIKEINKIGNNINQIARKTNLGFRSDESLKKSLSETQIKLDEAITLMNRIIQFNNPNFK